MRHWIVVILGWLFLLLGVVGLFLPFLQGLLLLSLGLVLLSFSSQWAQRLIDRLVRRFPKLEHPISRARAYVHKKLQPK
jgi:uncharacterized membrane protein YbaN (DUF454 family)